MIFMVVDFPAPFGPRKPTISPGSTLKEMSVTAGKFPKYLVTLLTSIIRCCAPIDLAYNTRWRLICSF